MISAETVAAKRNCWTNQEIRSLREAHAERKPTLAELAKLLPRHTFHSVEFKARKLGLRKSITRQLT